MNIEKIFGRIGKLSREQKKIIYISTVGLVFLLFFWLFIYGPKTRAFRAIKKKLSATEAEIAEILNIAKGQDLAAAVGWLNSDLIKVSSLLPAKEDVVISNLSESARKLSLEVKSIVPSAKKQLENKISGYDIEELPISMNLVSDFRSLGEYINRLRNNFPVLVRVREIEIRGKGEARTDLDVALRISAYLSKKK